ncbi:MAG TPA: hypothetical protein VN966_01445 [Candidatus Bathyarchaeia archaeon]|nr:hypothetical protein [Candidatus Bathyarchaeia archaeon]
MQSLSTIGFALTLVLFGVQPAFAQVVEEYRFHREWVEYEDGRISVDFDHIPLEVALNVIQFKTGLQIVIPSVTESKLLNLRLNQLPLEPAVRSLITSIGFRNFALVYDEKGQPTRAVVLEARPEVRRVPGISSNVDSTNEPGVEPLKGQERAQLQKELERWGELKQEDRSRIEDRLKTLPPSEDREQLFKEYGRQLLGIKN